MSEIKVEKQIPDNFTMVYNHCLEKLNDVYDISVYVCLSKFADYSDKTSFPSYQTIADKIGCSRNKVISSVKNLVKLGLVTKQKRRMQTSVYTIIHPVNLKEQLVHEVNSQTSKVHEVNSKGARGEPRVVHEVSTNDTHLTKPTSNNTQERAKPSTPSNAKERKKFFKSLEGQNEKQIEYLKTSMRNFKEKNPNKYPDEFLKDFFEQMTQEDDFGITRFQDTFSAKGKYTFSVGGQLNTWFTYWKPKSNLPSQPHKSFVEQEFDFKRQNLMNNLAWVEEIKNRQNLEIYEGNQVGKIN